MRIPPSVFVMSVLTAVPFGLAIKQTSHDKAMKHHDDVDDEDDFSPRDYDSDRDMREMKDSEARLEEMQAAERERKAKTEMERAKLAPMLVGDQPASLGTLFTGVKLGADAGNFQPDIVRQQIAEASDSLSVEWDVDATTLNGVSVTLKTDYDERECAPLASAVRAWGPKVGNGWENAATHQRATFDEYSCTLKFERFTDVDHFVDRNDAAIVPLSMIGQPAAKLRTRIAAHLDSDDEDTLSWHDVGLAGGTGPTRLTALVENGKVATITVELPDGMDLAPLTARLTKVEGVKGKHDDDEFTTTWRAGKASAVIYENIPSLVIGKRE
jgi:hypothetical protein